MADIKPEQFLFFKENRKHVRSKITRKYNEINSSIDSLDHKTCIDYLSELKHLSQKINSSNEQVSSAIWQHVTERTLLNSELDEIDQYDDKLRSSIGLIEDKLSSIQNGIQARGEPNIRHSQGEGSNPAVRLRLPEIPLPTFGNNEGENLKLFFDNLEDIINKYALSSHERFGLLEKQLRNDPFVLIGSLTFAKRSYEEAKALLMKAFGQTVNQKFDIIKKLSTLKFNHANPFDFISEMRLIISNFETLEVKVENVLEYFIWSRFPNEYQTQYLHITNKNKPNLEDIQEHIFEVAERVKTMSKPRLSKIESTSLAANVFSKKPDTNSKFKPCVLCDKVDAKHPMFKCEKFSSPTAKINKLKELKLCIKCGGPNHFANECKYPFKKSCYICNKNHFSFLCISSKKENVYNEKNTNNNKNEIKAKHGPNNVNYKTNSKDNINSGTCQVEMTASNVNVSQNILPTFTCSLKGGKKLRALLDSGAQISFINDKICHKHKFKILKKNVNITIKGFNSHSEQKTNVVEVPIFMKDKIYKICAVAIPEIKTDIKVKGLYDIAKKLVDKNYTIADDFILQLKTDRISNLDMILGANALFSLTGKIVNFGRYQDSCIFDTDIGILLMGESTALQSNIDSLPVKNKFMEDPVNAKHGNSRECAQANFSTLDDTDLHNSCAREQHVLPQGMHIVGDIPPQIDIPLNVDTEVGSDLDNYSYYANFISSNVVDDLLDELDSPIRENILKDNVNTLDRKCAQLLKFEDCNEDPVTSELNKKIINSTLESIKRDVDGRLEVPIVWHQTNFKLLAKNLELCKKILFSVTNKLKKDPYKLKMVEEVMNDQINMDIIQPIDDLDHFLQINPNASFLPFMPIFKLEKSTSKCRVVYLSNICERSYNSVNLTHNQTMLPGPPLNNKLMTSITQLRFNKLICIFDLRKAFHMLKLAQADQTKLCFLWYKNASAGDFSVRGYMCKRLPYGLRCSPYLLMLSLYYILIHTVSNEDELSDLKKNIYNLFYMDNGAISANSSENLINSFHDLPKIFGPYGFELQQFATNDPKLKSHITECIDSSDDSVKLLGMNWDTCEDTLSANTINLNSEADTKRKILSSIASNFDIYQMNGPMLNRARLFMHEQQCNPEIGWDTKLDSDSCKTWKNISKQVNNTPTVTIPRFVGKRESEYMLVGCVDASKDLYGVVIYALEVESGRLSFLNEKTALLQRIYTIRAYRH